MDIVNLAILASQNIQYHFKVEIFAFDQMTNFGKLLRNVVVKYIYEDFENLKSFFRILGSLEGWPPGLYLVRPLFEVKIKGFYYS